MIHVRIVCAEAKADAALDVLHRTDSVFNVVVLRSAAQRPRGDVILCDVAREDASVVLSDLKALGIQHDGSIALETIDTSISDLAEAAERHAPGLPSDAVVWEEVEARTSETVELSAVYVAFMVLAALLAMVGIFQDSAILIVGAMVVGPEFGPIAALCVAIVQRRPRLAARSSVALGVGLPLAMLAALVGALVLRGLDIAPDEFDTSSHQLANIIASPDWYTVLVAACAGAAGMLSLSTAKSSALIGVVISVTTIPAAANVGIALAYGDGDSLRGSLEQLGLNLVVIHVAGTLTLGLQRAAFVRRRRLSARRARTTRPPSS